MPATIRPLVASPSDVIGRSVGLAPALVILLGTTLASIPFLVLSIANTAGARLAWDNAHWTISAAGAAVAAVVSVRDVVGRDRTVRMSGALALVLWLLATLSWAWLNLTRTVTVPSVADLAVLGILVPGTGVLVGSVRGRLTVAEETAVYLDAILVLLFILAVVVVGFGPAVLAVPSPAAAAAIVYPTAFLGLAGAGLIALFAIGYPIAPRGGFALLAGSGLIGLAYLGWLDPAINLTDPGEVTSILFTLGTLVAGYGVTTWRDERSTSLRYLAAARLATRTVAPLGAGLLMLLVIAPTPDVIETPLHLTILAAAIAFVIRQGLLLRERTAMLAEVTDLTAANDRLVATLRDELRRRAVDERRIIAASRAAAVGNLAAGVAHEVNNPLTGILGFAELLIDEMDPADPRRPDVETIRDEAIRARDIVRAMRDFANPPAPQLVMTELSALVHGTVDLVRYSIERRGTTIVEDLPVLPPILIDGSAIQQALLNILTNARQATGEGGRITISSRVDGDARLIAIVDDGVGMDEATVGRAFDPFFSGHEDEELEPGAGLGLSISNGLIASHGGTIGISSSPGRGTTVEIRLPHPRSADDPEGGRGSIP